MFTLATPVSVAELAQLLIARKNAGKRTILFLGSKTGGLFGNQYFYNGMQRYSLRNFSKLSDLEKFDECYQLLKHLTDENSKKDLDGKELLSDLLDNWLREKVWREEDDIAYRLTEIEREEDKYMAELVKGGFFDIIISTNIDSLLEFAFSQTGMKSPEDYKVVNMLDDIVDVESIKVGKCTIIKAFGKLEQGSSVVLTGEISYDASQKLMALLNEVSNRDVLAIGYHPFWDKKAENVLMTKGDLWYINERLPESDVLIFDNNNVKYISGLYYRRFIQELYQIIDKEGLIYKEQKVYKDMSTNLNIKKDIKRKNIFISYSHRDDKKHLENLQKFLSVMVKKDSIVIWSDNKLKGGEDWHKEIQEALATTKVAILFVSINFLTSEYIDKYELPILLEAADKGEVILLPVLLASCPISKSALHRYQIINPIVPLNKMSKANQDVLWTELANRVDSLLFTD